MSNLDILRTWYDKVWVEEDLDTIFALFTPNTEAKGYMDFAMGPDDFHVMAETLLAQVCVNSVRFDRTVDLGNWVWVSFTGLAQRRTDDSQFEITGQVMARFEDEKVVEAYNQVDFLSLFEHLGYLPKDTLALCMSGEGIG